MPAGTSIVSVAGPALSSATGLTCSPARCTAMRVWVVTSSRPLKTRSSKVTEATLVPSPATSASASRTPPGMRGILTEQETNQMAGVIVDADMDVYLLPVSRDRYELYCEVPDEPEAPPEAEPP